jgi:hypothetical protein
VVLMVSAAVTGVVPEIAAGAVTEHVGISTAPVGLPVTAQVKATEPTKPLLGVTVTVAVPLAPGMTIPTAGPLSVKLGAGPGPGPVREVTVTSTSVPPIKPPFGVGIGMPNV